MNRKLSRRQALVAIPAFFAAAYNIAKGSLSDTVAATETYQLWQPKHSTLDLTVVLGNNAWNDGPNGENIIGTSKINFLSGVTSNGIEPKVALSPQFFDEIASYGSIRDVHSVLDQMMPYNGGDRGEVMIPSNTPGFDPDAVTAFLKSIGCEVKIYSDLDHLDDIANGAVVKPGRWHREGSVADALVGYVVRTRDNFVGVTPDPDYKGFLDYIIQDKKPVVYVDAFAEPFLNEDGTIRQPDVADAFYQLFRWRNGELIVPEYEGTLARKVDIGDQKGVYQGAAFAFFAHGNVLEALGTSLTERVKDDLGNIVQPGDVSFRAGLLPIAVLGYAGGPVLSDVHSIGNDASSAVCHDNGMFWNMLGYQCHSNLRDARNYGTTSIMIMDNSAVMDVRNTFLPAVMNAYR